MTYRWTSCYSERSGYSDSHLFMIDTDNMPFLYLLSDGMLLLHKWYTTILPGDDARTL